MFKMMRAMNLAVITLLYMSLTHLTAQEKILDHAVVLNEQNRLLPWTSYDSIITWSMNFIKDCPTRETKFGQDPWYLITAKFSIDGKFQSKQNNQGSNVYYAMENFLKYYAYSGDHEALAPVRLLADRVLQYFTPADWAWPNVPRCQDDTPDGEYTDEWSEPDKMCMVGSGYLAFYNFTGEEKYLKAAQGIGRTVAGHIAKGDAKNSPLPFRVNLQSGTVRDPYTANMIAVVIFFDALAKIDKKEYEKNYRDKRKLLLQWIYDYPMKNNWWSGYYEDVVSNYYNMNHQLPMETARYFLQHPQVNPKYKSQVPDLIAWVKNRFGKIVRFGATSIVEQDSCYMEMSSHTARYASIVAKWYGVTQNPQDREEARASFSLATYSAYNQYSKDGKGINYTGIGYRGPWFSDAYFDYLYHIFEGMAELPDMAPPDQDHIIGSTDMIKKVGYSQKRVEYWTGQRSGKEILRLSFIPQVFSEGKPLQKNQWTFGEYRGVANVLRLERKNSSHIVVQE
jgi:hypothetical protein